jgi:DMSO/TMAO reductase YedYZ molybdopterin-dependent catalytic subunit
MSVYTMSAVTARRAGIAVVAIAIVLMASFGIILLFPRESQSSPDVVLTVTIGNEVSNYTLDSIIRMPNITGYTGFVKTGTNPYIIVDPSNWTGVPMLYLLNLTGSLPANFSLKVLSSDGYITYFTRAEVLGSVEAYNSSTAESIGPRTFIMALAYMQDFELLTNETGGPLRLVLIPNGAYYSAGHSWPKLVREISVIDETEPWSLELNGVTAWNMTHDIYYSLSSCPHHRKFITLNNISYAGVALWTIVASMDGGNDIHYSFNNSLVSTNYTVTLWSQNGSSINFTSYELAYNNDMVLAGWADEVLLIAPEWPLKLVTASGTYLDAIVRIEMTGWQS